MKINVMKIGATINANNGSILTDEINVVTKMLADQGHDVHYHTTRTRNMIPLPHATFHDLAEVTDQSFSDYDALIVFNGNANFYGGQEARGDLMAYKFINKSKCPVFYFLTDWLLPLQQLWPNVEKKQVQYHWERQYTRDEIEVVREDIIMISQIYNMETLQAKYLDKRGINYADIIYFPLQDFIIHEYQPIAKVEQQDRWLDLIYGGTFRGGHRQDKMIEYYFDYPQDINVQMFGNIKPDHFSKKKTADMRFPDFISKKVKHREFFDRMQTSKATVTISDKLYEGSAISNRTNESIIGNVVSFIDRGYDPEMRIFSDDLLRKFNYVEKKSDVIARLKYLKDNPNAFDEIIKRQYEDATGKMSKEQYYKSFVNIVESKLENKQVEEIQWFQN